MFYNYACNKLSWKNPDKMTCPPIKLYSPDWTWSDLRLSRVVEMAETDWGFPYGAICLLPTGTWNEKKHRNCISRFWGLYMIWTGKIARDSWEITNFFLWSQLLCFRSIKNCGFKSQQLQNWSQKCWTDNETFYRLGNICFSNTVQDWTSVSICLNSFWDTPVSAPYILEL